MLSSRLAMGLGTLSLVAVSSLGTAVLVTDGAQRMGEPPVVVFRPAAPAFQAPPLVVPQKPGSVVSATLAAALGPRPALFVDAGAPVSPPGLAAAGVRSGSGERAHRDGGAGRPADAAPAPVVRVAQTVDLPGKGKHRGQLKDTRGKRDTKGTARTTDGSADRSWSSGTTTRSSGKGRGPAKG